MHISDIDSGFVLVDGGKGVGGDGGGWVFVVLDGATRISHADPGLLCGWMDEWMNGWMVGWMVRWMVGWMDG